MVESISAAPPRPLPLWAYGLVYIALLGLTAATVAAAYVDLGRMNNVVAIAIAAVKASLVGLFFMHLKGSSRLVQLASIAGLFWLFYLVAGLMLDYATRGWLGAPGK